MLSDRSISIPLLVILALPIFLPRKFLTMIDVFFRAKNESKTISE